MKKVCVIFGGVSTEHDVSVVSGTSVIKNLDKSKYEILPIFIDRKGDFYHYTKKVEDIEIAKIGEELSDLEIIDNIVEVLKSQDVAFPVLHGLNRRRWKHARISKDCRCSLCWVQDTCIKCLYG